MDKIKLIAVDMDGTFLCSDSSYNRERFRKLYKRMKKQGVKFVVASGNQYYQLKSFFEDYQDELTYVAENGGYIIENKVELFSVSIPKVTVMHVIDILKQYPEVKVCICGKKSAYVLRGDNAFYEHMSNFYHRLNKVEDFAEIDDQFIKLAIKTPSDSTRIIRDKLHSDIGKDLVPVVSGHVYVDLIFPGCNKGTGIRLLQNKWSIDPSACLAFGDGGNDIEMLKQVKYSYAMENASEEVKAVAAYHTTNNNNAEGVLDVIEQFLQVQE